MPCHTVLQKVIIFLSIVLCAGKNCGRGNGSYKVSDIRKYGTLDGIRTGETGPGNGELLPGHLADKSPFYLSPALFLAAKGNYLTRNHLSITPTRKPSSRQFERRKKQPDKVKSISYDNTLPKYLGLQTRYLLKTNADFEDDENVMEYEEHRPHPRLESSYLPFIMRNHIYLLPGFFDGVDGTLMPLVIADEGSRRFAETKYDKYRELPKNHKYSKLDQVPYHAPFSNHKYLKSGYVEGRLVNENPNISENMDPSYAEPAFGDGFSQGGGSRSRKSYRNAERLHSIPYHAPFSKPKVLKSGYIDNTHEVIVIVKKTSSAFTKRFIV